MPPLSKKTEPEVAPSQEWISVKHSKVDYPDGVLPRRVPRDAFDEVWSGLGWEAIPGTESTDPAPVIVEETATARTVTSSASGGA